jgi:2-polyprenyl-3-methyl-5-hydroxy-6-metoxy-1,4-benzoquinol methylase
MIDHNELQREEEFWDKVGVRWLGAMKKDDLIVKAPNRFLSGGMVSFDYLMAQMGDLKGRTVLDYGCGSGWLSTYLAQRGATVEGFDISAKLVELAMRRAQVNGVGERVRLERMIAEELKFPDSHFDLVVGISILHHIALEEGSRELHRVMKPGGRAFFIEPLGESTLQNALRSYVFRYHHGHIRTVDAEHPLTYKDIQAFGARFANTTWKELQLTEMVARVTGDTVTKMLGMRALDTALLKTFPSLRKQCRLVVIKFEKGQ